MHGQCEFYNQSGLLFCSEKYVQPNFANYIRLITNKYCHPAYLTYMQSASCKMSGWMKHKLESRLLGETSINLRYADDTPLTAESEEELKSPLIKMKEGSEKAGLKLSIEKTKTMAPSPITSWQIDWETMETVKDFIFLGSKITADGDCSHEIKRCLLLGRKAMTNLDSIQKQRYYKDLSSQSHGFSRSHVWMWELDHKKSWSPKNGCFWTVVLEKTLESPLDCKEIQPINLQGNRSWVFIGRTDAEAETPILWPPDAKNWLLGKDPDTGKDWRQGEKGTTEDEMVGWHHQLDGHQSEQTLTVGDGQGGLACCSPWSHKRSDMTEWLNGTDHQHIQIYNFLFLFLV